MPDFFFYWFDELVPSLENIFVKFILFSIVHYGKCLSGRVEDCGASSGGGGGGGGGGGYLSVACGPAGSPSRHL